MGISLDYAAKTWKKENQTVWVPQVVSRFEREDDQDAVDAGYDLLSESDGLIYMGPFRDGAFQPIDFKRYQRNTATFVEHIKNLSPSLFRTWVMHHQDCMIHFDYEGFLASPSVQQVEKKKWVPSDFIRLHEDGKLLMRAQNALSDLYGVSLSPVLLSQDELLDYDEEDPFHYLVDQKLTMDTSDIADIMEYALQRMQKRPYDEFFEDRMKRCYILLDALKQGAKFVYSV